MKKLLLLLLIIISFTSCEPDDICGNVTGHDIRKYGNSVDYIIYVDGNSRSVTLSTYIDYPIGSSICLE